MAGFSKAIKVDLTPNVRVVVDEAEPFVYLDIDEGCDTTMLNLDEAKAVRKALKRAIRHIKAGV